MQLSVSLSKLVPSKRNPRRVKPERDAHRKLVASIRSNGLIEPLVIRRNGDQKHYLVIVGNRRLSALRDVHRGEKRDPKIECVLRDVDDKRADSMALAENFAREPMHPLDEAEAFAKLAGEEGKEAGTIASEFGVSEHYVRQRMMLATLAKPVKAAYRESRIDTGTAEAFSAVPAERQEKVWEELGGNPQHAQHVRNVIANEWIDASHALFDVSTLLPSLVSRDLFNERVLVERGAFLEAQQAALDAEKTKLTEDGWAEVIVGRQQDVQDRLFSMTEAEVQYDKATSRQLRKIDQRWEKAEAKIAELEDGDEAASESLQEKLSALEAAADRIRKEATTTYAETTKAIGTAFLLLDPDGQVRRVYRVPRQRRDAAKDGTFEAHANGNGAEAKAPTSDDLHESQLAATYVQESLAVREAVLGNRLARKRLLILILHEAVRSEALSISKDANAVTLHATMAEGFSSAAFDRVKAKRAKVDTFDGENYVSDMEAYKRLSQIGESKLDAMIDVLTVEHITAHLQRRTELVNHLATELKVGLRDHWRPDAKWLGSYKKIQLAHLLSELLGPAYRPDNEQRKKTELVDAAAKLFTDAAEGKLDDKQVTQRVNEWLPSNMRKEDSAE